MLATTAGCSGNGEIEVMIGRSEDGMDKLHKLIEDYYVVEIALVLGIMACSYGCVLKISSKTSNYEEIIKPRLH